MSIPEWLEGMLKEGRYKSTYDMSLRWGIPEPTISRWLNGQRTPSAPSCMKLAGVTDTPVQDVIQMAHGDGEDARDKVKAPA